MTYLNNLFILVKMKPRKEENHLNHDKRFFESTRGRMVLALRSGSRTVNDLAAALDLTDNAVRAQLLGLERDGLVVQGKPIKGFRKPHSTYYLSDEARHLFPKPYHSLFNRLLDVLKSKISLSALTEHLSETGRKLGSGQNGNNGLPLDERLAKAVLVLEELGGAPIVVNEENRVVIKSACCPFADAVSEHPEVCKLAEAAVSEIVGIDAEEKCDRSSGLPRCSFEINLDGENKGQLS